ncbi:hypothetical protein M2283_008836 [Streptomyces pseudovenezuelae]|uniref:Uncharacterized protein n=1 Tax=Streptomyces pseudovenezuelae TaxID=67350 RepID=A0ABT6M1G1_9ACTN|nr:hypothetical protein [Streptomyces pseudovenezuelae]
MTSTTKALMAHADGSGYRAAGLCAANHPSSAMCTQN